MRCTMQHFTIPKSHLMIDKGSALTAIYALVHTFHRRVVQCRKKTQSTDAHISLTTKALIMLYL